MAISKVKNADRVFWVKNRGNQNIFHVLRCNHDGRTKSSVMGKTIENKEVKYAITDKPVLGFCFPVRPYCMERFPQPVLSVISVMGVSDGQA